MIYLDYQATTPVAPEVAEAMAPWIEEKFANPHSPSRWGREADAAIDVARRQVERSLELEGGAVAFTGSATEAINWAIRGTLENAPPERNRIITIATEHAAVLDTCEWLASRGVDVTILPVGPDGLLDLSLLDREIDERVALVAAMMVNNEIGVIQPVSEISAMARSVGRADAVRRGPGAWPHQPARRTRSGRHQRAQASRPQGDWRLVDAQGRRAGATDPRRRARARASVGHFVAGTVRRLRRRREACGRAADARFRPRAAVVPHRHGSPWRRLGGQRQPPLPLSAAISTCAATASMARACLAICATSHFHWARPAPADRAVRAMC